MLQKGIGERFKYKQAVLEKFPNAVCVRLTYKYGMRFYVKDKSNGNTFSKKFRTAEYAWAYVWINIIKQ